MRVLVTGGSGLLGAAIARHFEAHADDLHFPRHADLDITDQASVMRAAASVRPEVMINCAAYNDVDGAEDDPRTALAVNAMAVLNLARAARDVGAIFVHYGSDFVFDGQSSRPYVEEDAPGPQSVYGASKLLGEWLAADAPRHYVLRVESLFGFPGSSGTRRGSLGTIVDRIQRSEPVPVFVDRTVSPSFTTDVAVATRRLIVEGAPAGVYHCVNDGAATWLEVAQEAARVLGADFTPSPLTLEAVTLRARRPRYCALSPARLAALGIVMPPWRDAIRRYLSGG